MRKLLSMTIILTMMLSMGITASAATTADETDLTPEQIAVMEEYENNMEQSVEATSSPLARANTTYRGSLHRGSFLMWSEDFVSWTTNGSSISASTAWQDGGYVFPNIIKLSGITKYLTSSSSVTYRAKKTLGAGVVTPWGDVSVYNSDFTDYLQANANGTLRSY